MPIETHHSHSLACDPLQGRRREQVEHSSNIASACFVAMAAMIAASVLLETREWWHDPKVFSKSCGAIV